MKTTHYFQVEISETGRNTLSGDSSLFNKITECFETKEEAKDFIIERYGKIPGGKNKTYLGMEDGTTVAVGFTHSFWDKDWSHNSSKWFQTDWIIITEVTKETTPVFIN